MKTLVLDSWGIMEWLLRRRAGEVVNGLLEEADSGKSRLLMSAINVGEVYYFLRKHHQVSLADEWRQLSATLPVCIEVPSSTDIWSAALLKGSFPIAYADAFAAALAQKYNCPLVTGDPEFRTVSDLQLMWIGPVRNGPFQAN